MKSTRGETWLQIKAVPAEILKAVFRFKLSEPTDPPKGNEQLDDEVLRQQGLPRHRRGSRHWQGDREQVIH